MPDSELPGCPGIERGQIIPAFTLPGADGTPYSPWQYKQREHLLLLFVNNPQGAQARAILQTFVRRYGEFREEEATLLAITAEPVITNLQVWEELHLPFPLLSDAQNRVIPRYTRWDQATRTLAPSLLLADRYGALYERWVVETEAALPPLDEPLEMLCYLNRLCTP